MGKKVFIAGGGTGGHFYPAVSVASFLKEKGYQVLYIGAEKGIEGKKDFPYGEKILFDIKGVRGKNLSEKIFSAYQLLKTTNKVKEMIKEEKPDFSICFGGYASFPLGLASVLEKVPLYIHEQNSIPSYTNKLLSFFARKIFITFEYSKQFFPEKKTVLSGFPLRKELKEKISLDENEARKKLGIPENKKNILVFGGSQGAKKLTELAEILAEKNPDIYLTVITGKNSKISKKRKNLISFDYFEDMGVLYKGSDLVIARAGAGTVSEILLFGKPAIFVPYPYAASNHQFFNVKWLKDLSLAEVFQEKELSLEKINKTVKEFLNRNDISDKIKKYAIYNAEEIILNEIEKEQV